MTTARALAAAAASQDRGKHATAEVIYANMHSSHRYARAPTPAPRQGVRRQRSDPGLASPDYREQASYFEVSVPRRSYSRRRDPSWRGDSYQSYGSGYEDDWYANAPARLSGRSGDRYHGYGELDD